MRCPNCRHTSSKVVDSRHADEMNAIRRRRECDNCGTRFTTFERMELSPLVVIKKDGTREVFDRAKVLDGLLKVCEKERFHMKKLKNGRTK